MLCRSRTFHGATISFITRLRDRFGVTSCLLADRQASDLPVSRQDAGRPTSRRDDPNLLQDGSRSSSAEQARNAAHVKALLCDGTRRGRSRLDGNQQVVGAQQLRDDNGLLALQKAASGDGTQSDRLASGQAMPQMGRSDIGFCRTQSLGSHVYHCGQCDHRVTVYNS